MPVADTTEYREKAIECPKCGNGRAFFRVHYQKSGEYEWLLVHCICGFGWKETTNDVNRAFKTMTPVTSQAAPQTKNAAEESGAK